MDLYNVIDQLPAGFRDAAAGWEDTFAAIGMNLLYSLALIGFAIEAISLAVQRTPLEGYLPMLARQALIVGIGVWFIGNSQWLASSVIDSFRLAGAQAAGMGPDLAPSYMLKAGLLLFRSITSTASILAPSTAIGTYLIGAAVLACFAWVTCLYILALIEMFITVAALPLFVAWIGMPWSRGIAFSSLRYPIAAGAKLMTLMLLAGVLNALVTTWVASFEATGSNNIDVLFGFALLSAALVHTVPSLVSGMVHGAAGSGAQGLLAAISNFRTGAGMAGGALKTGLVGTAGGVAAAAAAKSLAHAKSPGGLKVSDVPITFAGGVAGAIGDKLSGRMSPHASTGWGAAANMRDKARLLRSEQAAPKPTPENLANRFDGPSDDKA